MFAVLGLWTTVDAAAEADTASVAIAVALITAVATLATGAIATLGAIWSRSARHELRPNGGASTRDAIDQLKVSLDEHREESQAHRTHVNSRLDALEAKQSAPVQLVEPYGHVAPVTPVEPVTPEESP